MTDLEPEAEAVTAPPSLSPRHRMTVLLSMCLALVLVIAGVTMLVNALSLIAEDLNLSQAKQAWVVDAYALPFAALLMIAGAIGDRYGRRGALLAGTALFGFGSLLSALVSSGNELLACRAITGVGAALIMPGTLSTITSVFPAEQRSRAVGVWSGFAMGGGTLGLLGSGLLLQQFWWGSVFVVAAGIALVTFVVIALAVPSTRSSRPVSLDPAGTALSAIGVGALVFGIIEGPEHGWTSLLTVGSVLLAVVALVMFVWWELRVEEPLLDPRLFRLAGFGTGAAGLFIMFLALFGFFLVSMQFLQLMLGYSPLKAAVALLPQMAVMIPLSIAAAPLSMRVGQRRLTTIGLVFAALGMASFATLDAHSPYAQFLVCIILVSIGVGLSMTPATTAIVNALPLAKQGVASAVNDTSREIGAALGVAVLGSAFNTAYRSKITPALDGLTPETAASVKEAPAVALETARGLGSGGPDLTVAAQHAFESGLRAAVLLSAALLALGALYTWWRAPGQAEAAAPSLDDELDALTAEALVLVEPDPRPVPCLRPC
ncbi:MAG TPA: MFS transporter [Acidimicrobiales bacterium]|jgi:EmrB/QacA subfamily drug resistance transporter